MIKRNKKTKRTSPAILKALIVSAVLMMLISVMSSQEGKNKRKVNIMLQIKEAG